MKKKMLSRCVAIGAGAFLLMAVELQAKPYAEIPSDVHFVLQKATGYAGKGRFQDAIGALNPLVSGGKTVVHPAVYYDLAYYNYQVKSYDKALGFAKKATELAPKYKEAWQILAHAWQARAEMIAASVGKDKAKKNEAKNAYQAGARAMEQAIKLGPDNELLYTASQLWLQGGEANKALVGFKKLSQAENVKEHWLLGLAEAHKALNSMVENAESIEKAAKLTKNPQLYFHAAYLWYELKKNKRALPLLETIAKRSDADKNWLLLLVSVYSELLQPLKAAPLMERVVELDPSSENIFNCGLLWLQGQKPAKALEYLLQLKDVEPPNALWFVAIAQSYLLQENIRGAADGMERAAQISGDPEHTYQAGSLRVQLKEADRAIGLLSLLENHKGVKSPWMVALSQAWVLKENYRKAAHYMEKAAYLHGMQGKLFHNAGMLWQMVGEQDKVIELLSISIEKKDVIDLWRVNLAAALVAKERFDRARGVMATTNLGSSKVENPLRYRGALVWLTLERPAKALPLLEQLGKTAKPELTWLKSLAHTAADQGAQDVAKDAVKRAIQFYGHQQSAWELAAWYALSVEDFPKAIAALEVVSRFEPQNKKHLKELSYLYRVVGMPAESASLFEKGNAGSMGDKELEELRSIYLAGKLYKKGVVYATEFAKRTNTAENWEVVGDTHYALYDYEQSWAAYEKAVELKADDPALIVKSGYAALKAKRFSNAAASFKEVLRISEPSSEYLSSARRGLDYVKRRLEMRGES